MMANWGEYSAMASAPPPDNSVLLQEVARASNGLALWLSKRTYVSGEEVVGRLTAQVNKRVTVRAVRVKLSGVCKIQWYEDLRSSSTSLSNNSDRDDFNDRRQEIHRVADLFPPIVVTVYGPDKYGPVGATAGGSDLHLQPGSTYEWPFRFVLPPNLPMAIQLREDTYIRYQLTGFCDIPNWPDQTVKHDIDIAPAPTYVLSDAYAPVERQEWIGVPWCWCFCKSPAVFSLSMPSRVIPFVEGRNPGVKVFAGLHNTAGRTLKSPRIILRAVITLDTGVERTTYTMKVAEQDLGRDIHRGQALTSQTVTFPDLVARRTREVVEWPREPLLQVPTTNAVNGMLRVDYELVMTASVSCARGPQLVVPVVVQPIYDDCATRSYSESSALTAQ